MEKKQYPFQMKNVDAETTEKINKYWKSGATEGLAESSANWITVGPKEYLMPKTFEEIASKVYDMEVRSTDVWVVSTPRSGTLLMQEMAWQICNEMDFTKRNPSTIPMDEKFPFLEFSSIISQKFIEEMVQKNPEFESRLRAFRAPVFERLEQMTGRRFIKTHLPFSLLPPGLLDKAKVIYITRNPRDLAVSFYHLNKSVKNRIFVGDFPMFWKLFAEGQMSYQPFFAYVKEAWAKKNHPNILFLFYEDVIKDMPKAIRSVASHLDKHLNDQQVSMLTEHLHIENCQRNKTLNFENHREIGLMVPDAQSYIRKGGSGGWRSYFDSDMTRQADQWIDNNLKDTKLRFPNYE